MSCHYHNPHYNHALHSLYPRRLPRLLLLLGLLRPCRPFSGGAPLSACEDAGLVPRHGFPAQAGPPPLELVMDQAAISPDTYLRVTIRSRRAFKVRQPLSWKLSPFSCHYIV